MITIFRLELLRVVRDRRFWFFALLGVPVLLPLAVIVLAVTFASTGTVEPATVRATVAVTQESPEMVEFFDQAGIPVEVLATRDQVATEIQAGRFTVGVVDIIEEPDAPMSATVLANVQSRGQPVYRDVHSVLNDYASSRRQSLMDSLDFVGESFDLLVAPIQVTQEPVPYRLRSGLVPLVTVIWGMLLVFPYLLLTFNGGAKMLTDRLEGYLSPVTSSALPAWQWLLSRWCALSTVGAVLLAYSAILFVVYMWFYGKAADVLVSQGVLEGLSEVAALGASAYLVDMVALWRETSVLSYLLWIIVASFQIAALCALLVWGAARASSLPQFRIFELIPFMLIFIVPLAGLGALGNGFSVGSWLPGLNMVLSAEYVIAGGLPGSTLLIALGLVLMTNLVFIAACLAPAAMALRREALWSS
ncbi:MAG: hypothetical protein EA417_07805 [Gammaproteobacteria bacterium]|nr:MAG: hypothetical protein EA417_07805 [Gammaproteobacteria bacterium]